MRRPRQGPVTMLKARPSSRRRAVEWVEERAARVEALRLSRASRSHAGRDLAADPAASRLRPRYGETRPILPVTEPQTPACRRTRSARALPLAGFGELLDLPDDQILLQAAQTIDEQRAIEMIHLVLEAAGEKPLRSHRLRFAVAVESLDDGPRWPRDRRVEPRHAEAAFLFELHAVAFDELGIDEDEQ